MSCYSLIIMLLLPVLAVGQVQFVSFLPDESELSVSGEYGQVLLVFNVDPGYHIQTNEVLETNLIATTLSLTTPDGLFVCQNNFPKPQTIFLGGKVPLQVFEDVFKVGIEIHNPDNLPPGHYPFKGELYYQTCDDRKCYFPRTLAFEAPMKIIGNP